MDEVDERSDFGVRLRQLLQARDRLGELQLRAVQDAVGVADVADLLLAEAATLEAFGVDGVRHAPGCR